MRSIWFDKVTYLFVWSYHVTYAFQSESALYNCLNVKELLAQNRREIWSLSDCNRTHNHLVHKRTLIQLTKLVHLLTKWLWVRVPLQSLQHIYFDRLFTLIYITYITYILPILPFTEIVLFSTFCFIIQLIKVDTILQVSDFLAYQESNGKDLMEIYYRLF